MTTAFKPFAFDTVHDAALLNAAGYECRSYAAHWTDIGGPESGPKLCGHPAFDSWELPGPDSTHCIIVQDGYVVDVEVLPAGPDDLPF